MKKPKKLADAALCDLIIENVRCPNEATKIIDAGGKVYRLCSECHEKVISYAQKEHRLHSANSR